MTSLPKPKTNVLHSCGVTDFHRKTPPQGIELIKYFEGYSSKEYLCPAGYRTIGYGHKCLDGEIYNVICQEFALQLLMIDLQNFEFAVLRNIDVPLSDNQYAALISFTYNLGPAALQRSTLRQKINYGDYDEITSEFLRWIYVIGKKSKGLILRRRAEARLFCEV